MTVRSNIITLALAAATLAGCGKAGEADKVACALCGSMNDLKGSISTMTGSQARMQGWVVASFEHDTGIARVSEVDNAGLYTLSHVRTDYSQTMALFTPDYILQGVLSIPGAVDKTIRQFVTFKSPTIPKLINNGPIITFQNFDGLQIQKDMAADQDADGIPDGAVSITGAGASAGSSFALTAAPPQDTDLDGLHNDKDPDLDGDGVINWLDSDDNGNGILDVFDADQNSDLNNDAGPDGHNTDQYFPEGVEYIAVQFEMAPKDDGSGTQTSLKFVTKVRDDVTPLAVQIRGAPSLLNSATYIAKDQSGNDTVQPWNRLLQDDGLSEDGGAGDRLFAKKVLLADANTPRAHESIFFQLVFGTKDKPWYLEFPWSFPDLKPATVSAQYDTNTRTVLLIGNPFGQIQDFVWLINVFDSKGTLVWPSQAIPGTTRQFQVQENVFAPGETYKFSVVAQTLDKIPGYPAYSISSIKYPMN